MLFATICIAGSPSQTFTPRQRVPEGAFSKERLAQLLAKGYVIDVPTEPPAKQELPPANEDKSNHPSDWAFDPKDLAGKSVDVLNVMILEHVRKHGLGAVEPFETSIEAVMWMSKDRRTSEG